MDGCSTDGNGEIFDVSPYLKLVIDKDGRWFQKRRGNCSS